MAELVLGPLLRYVAEREATVWVETSHQCEVEVLGRTADTFCIRGHHYALVCIRDLEPGCSHEYEVLLNGERRWPEPGSGFPPSLIRTVDPDARLRISFGSCRVAVPHRPPYTLTKDQDEEHGREIDALYALSHRMRSQDPSEWPQLLMLLGDQVYADEDAPETRAFIQYRRDTTEEPGDDVADFEEYTRLYRETWGPPEIRWLMSTVGTTMIFDDHDVHDDWNSSISWLEEMRAKPWWEDRIAGALVSYWAYQHLGNLAPDKIDERGLLERVMERDDAGDFLHEWACDQDWGSEGRRWSYSRDLGGVRLVVLDSREGRVLGEKPRKMFDEDEWEWLRGQISGDVEHLVVCDTLPILMPPALHHLEAWNEAVCAGVWGGFAAGLGERFRRAFDLEHWAAFQNSFHRILDLFAEVGAGRSGKAPRSIVTLAGDIHHAYLARARFPDDAGVRSAVWQGVCSPFRNPLERKERRFASVASRHSSRWLTRGLARAAGVKAHPVEWELTQRPTFDNQVGTLEFEGPRVRMKIERTVPGDWREPVLKTSLDEPLC